jgi:Flp pilus assembly pilin Flp
MVNTSANRSRGATALRSEFGSSLVEYALLLSLIVSVAISGITLVGRQVTQEFDCVALDLANAGIRQVIVESEHEGHWHDGEWHPLHWHDLSADEKEYVRACL